MSRSSLLAACVAWVTLLAAMVTTASGFRALALAAAPQVQPDPHGRGLAESGWPKAWGDAQNTGRGIGHGAAGVLKWEFTAKGPIVTQPVLGPDGAVYVGSYDGNFYALEGETGQVRWKHATWGPIWSTAAVGANGLVYVGSAEGVLYALDTRTGEVRWKFAVRHAANTREEVGQPGEGGVVSVDLTASPTIGPDGTIYFGARDGYFYALNGETGAKRWEARVNPQPGCPALALNGRSLYVPGSRSCLGLDTADGSLTLRALGVQIVEYGDAFVAARDGTLYACGYAPGPKGVVVALEPGTRAEKWHFVSGTGARVPALGLDGSVLCSCYSKSVQEGDTLYDLDPVAGTVRWKWRPGEGYGIGRPSVAADGVVYVGVGPAARLQDKWEFGPGVPGLYALDGKTGTTKWSFRPAGSVNCQPAIGADGTIYFGTNEGHVYAIR